MRALAFVLLAAFLLAPSVLAAPDACPAPVVAPDLCPEGSEAPLVTVRVCYAQVDELCHVGQ